MNTAPNRRASDNASSPPGTSPTRRFSDMLKESSGSGGDGILVVDAVITGDGYEQTATLTKTYREIKNAAFAIIAVETGIGTDSFSRNIATVRALREDHGSYMVGDTFDYIYETDNIDGYPSAQVRK